MTKNTLEFVDAACLVNFLNKVAKKNIDYRGEIYRIKIEFIKLLIEEGFCVGAFEHNAEKVFKKKCRECSGMGCSYCNNGVYLYRANELLLSLSFYVYGTIFNWHVPKRFFEKEIKVNKHVEIKDGLNRTVSCDPEEALKRVKGFLKKQGVKNDREL